MGKIDWREARKMAEDILKNGTFKILEGSCVEFTKDDLTLVLECAPNTDYFIMTIKRGREWIYTDM